MDLSVKSDGPFPDLNLFRMLALLTLTMGTVTSMTLLKKLSDLHLRLFLLSSLDLDSVFGTVDTVYDCDCTPLPSNQHLQTAGETPEIQEFSLSKLHYT